MRTYTRILGGIALLTVVAIWGLALWLEPADGDLARVGGFAENDFHWRAPQRVFEKNLFRVAADLSEYDQYFDVVVLGDSFSCDQESRFFGWQNEFIAQTGLSMLVLDTRKHWPQEVLASEGFRKFPPKVFVFQSVERYLLGRTAYFSKVPVPAAVGAPQREAIPVRTVMSPHLAVREEQPIARASRNPDHVLGHLGAIVRRELGLNQLVRSVPLAKSGLFTSRNDRDMLVYFDEFDKKQISESDLYAMRAGVRAFSNLVTANGVTQFVLLVAPDKTSLYGPYLRHAEDATVNLVAELAKDPTLPVVRTDVVLAEAIRNGAMDIYLPNDSHWNSNGHRLVADALAKWLRKAETGKLKPEG